MRDFENEKILLDNEHGVVTCEKLPSGLYDLRRVETGARVCAAVSTDVVELLYRSQRMWDAATYTLEEARELRELAKRLLQPFVLAPGGNSVADFLRDNKRVSCIIDVELCGMPKLRAFFNEHGFDFDTVNPLLKDHNRTERGSRDFSFEPFTYWAHIPGAAQVYPVVIYPDGTVGAGRRFEKPIGRLRTDGLIVCGYQVFPMMLLKAGWPWTDFEGLLKESAFADGYRNYGEIEPILAQR